MRRKTVKWGSVALAAGLVLAACGDDEDDGETTDTTAEGGSSDTTAAGGDGGASGTVNVSGSSTVEPISVTVAELFADTGSEATVNVDGPGTGDGFVLFCDGETDISDASRPIAADEVETCAANGVEFIELKVAVDGLSVITSTENTEIECLSFADLYALSGPESQGFESWSDAQELATELGSTTSLPDASLDITAPGEESGTYDSYVELAIGPIAEERGQDEVTRPDYQSSGDDNIIIQGIGGSPTSFGWVGFAFAIENTDSVRQFDISAEPGGECVTPTPETIASNEYPLSRDLYIYVNVASAEENPAVAEYVDFYLSDEGIAAVEEVGYVALTDEALAETRGVWEERTTGTRDGG